MKKEKEELVECPQCKEQKEKYWVEKHGVCYWCHDKNAEEKWLEHTKKETVEKGSSFNEDCIICPYCGYVCSEDDLHESTDTYCDGCEKEFHLEVEYTPHYSTSKLEKK